MKGLNSKKGEILHFKDIGEVWQNYITNNGSANGIS